MKRSLIMLFGYGFGCILRYSGVRWVEIDGVKPLLKGIKGAAQIKPDKTKTFKSGKVKIHYGKGRES